MPMYLRLSLVAMVLAATASARAQSDDRYSDWRAESSAPATAEPQPAENAPQATATESPQPPAAEPDWQPPPRTLRQLPFRFERAPAGFDSSRVVQASAMQPVRSLPKPSAATGSEQPSRSAASDRSRASATSMVSIAGSVAVVVGLFLIVAWTARRGIGSVPPTLPRDALEVLGRKRFTGKQEMQLVRVGSKLVLIHMVPGHAEPICEITDPAEVDRLTGICYQLHPRSSTKNFRETFDKFATERPAARPAARTSADKLDLSIFESVGRRAS